MPRTSARTTAPIALALALTCAAAVSAAAAQSPSAAQSPAPPTAAARPNPAGSPALELPAPELVAPGVVSAGLSEFSATTAPDGTLFFVVTDASFTRMTIMTAPRDGTTWGTPTVAPFSGRWNDGDLALSPDGRRIVFISNRPEAGDSAAADLDLWMTDRRPDGSWSEPVRLPAAFNGESNETYPSLAADRTLYFGRDRKFYRARWMAGHYGEPEELPFGGFSIAVAPDQRFAIIGIPGASPRDFDLALVRRRADGGWDQPVRLEGPVNSPLQEFAASISADGRWLWFASTRPAEPVHWPRPSPVRTMAEVRREAGIDRPALRDVYRVDLMALR